MPIHFLIPVKAAECGVARFRAMMETRPRWLRE
jgi:hypothetical protein